MTVAVLADVPAMDRRTRRRWLWSFIITVVLHLSVGGAVLFWRPSAPPLAEPAAAILVDLAPLPTAPPEPITDIPPGPEQVETPPEPQPEPEPLPDTPEVEQADAVLKPAPRPEEEEEEKEEEQAADQTTAPPSVEAPVEDKAAAPVEGAPSFAQSTRPVTWQSALLGRLERFKRYPPAAQRNRQEGIVYVRMVLDRKGQVLERRIAQSSGIASLDSEALALIDRAEPLPPPPPEVEGDSIDIIVPIEFFLKR